jgi:hypothetical protein
VPAPNRVTPFGEIVSIPQRGSFMGNRGSIHRDRVIVRPWQTRRWITCLLEYKGWVAPKWAPGRWTPLFFYDEAVALAAGHRPCALCRRADYNRWLDAWEWALGERPGADAIDLELHAERLDGKKKRIHSMPWKRVPAGAFVVSSGTAALVLEDRLLPWSAAGYGSSLARPSSGSADLLTPPSTVAVIRHGYRPVLHPSAGRE